MELSTELYPSSKDIEKSATANSWSPPLLRKFLSILVPHETKQSSIGQCIIKASRPRTAIPPLLFGIGIEVDHVFGSRWLIDELFTLGFSILYPEVTRFKQSVVQNQEILKPVIGKAPGTFTQWVGDNVDHNVRTLDGTGTFHAMGIISASTTSSLALEHLQQPVPRKQMINSKALVFNKGVPIVSYSSPFKPALASLKLKPRVELLIPFVPFNSNIDLLWQSSWFFTSSQNPRPN